MKNSKVYQWIDQQENRKKILIVINQPVTARQLARRTGIPQDTCSYLTAKFAEMGLLACLNPKARSSRLYWLTKRGGQYRKKLYLKQNLSYSELELPEIDWQLYGWVCFSHRSAVIKTLTDPMQPSEIKRILRIQRSHIRISANNIRDIINLFLARNIVKSVKIRKKAHLRYELTDSGTKLRQLLVRAENAL